MANRQIRHFLVAVTFGLASIASDWAIAGKTDIEWLTGHWCASEGNHIVEEYWLPPHKGVAIGMGRTRSAEATKGFEYFRMVDIDGTQSYVAQPGGRPPTVFKRTSGGKGWVRFENLDHDFPQRIEYRREGAGLHATVSGVGGDGAERVIRFDYRPCDSLAPVNAGADVAAIKAIREESNLAIARHDVETVVSSLDEDYVITISTGDILYGREPQAATWADHFAEFRDVVYVRTPTEVTISDAYPLAIENGTWEGSRTTPNGKLNNSGSYTASWRKVDGAWKIRSELFVGLACEGADC